MTTDYSAYSRTLIDSLPSSPWGTIAPVQVSKHRGYVYASKDESIAAKRANNRKHMAAKRLAEKPIYTYPRLPNGRFLPMKAGQVWAPEKVNLMKKLATRVNPERDWCKSAPTNSSMARR